MYEGQGWPIAWSGKVRNVNVSENHLEAREPVCIRLGKVKELSKTADKKISFKIGIYKI